MHTRSTSGRDTTSRQSAATCGTPSCRAASSAFSRRALASDTTSTPGHARKAGTCVVRANPAPMTPTRTG